MYLTTVLYAADRLSPDSWLRSAHRTHSYTEDWDIWEFPKHQHMAEVCNHHLSCGISHRGERQRTEKRTQDFNPTVSVCGVHSARKFLRLWWVRRGRRSRMEGSSLTPRMNERFHLEPPVEDLWRRFIQCQSEWSISPLWVDYTGKNWNKTLLILSLGSVCSRDVFEEQTSLNYTWLFNHHSLYLNKRLKQIWIISLDVKCRS